jgi:EAL domain-containing protein (putative c-di-GMP-specific phosphodiesterase class I)
MASAGSSDSAQAHGVPANAQAILLYSLAPSAFHKLKAVLHLHQLSFSEPLPNTILLTTAADSVTQAVSQWREGLTAPELDEVRGALLETPKPSAEDIEHALLRLAELDVLLGRLHGRWLLKVLEADTFFIMFQPLVSVAERRTVAYECLLRARDNWAVIGAERLLATARLMGLTRQLDHAAWGKAVKLGRDILHQGYSLFINFTPSSIYDRRFGLLETMAICQKHDVQFDRLVFEVTEAERVPDLGRLKDMIREYRAEGAKVALDDLGSGYSSILHLTELQPDYIKLDQELVRGAHNDYVRSVLLKAVTDAAHELGIFVVAEGVETEEDLKFCIAIDADLAQGYFLAQPAEVPPVVSADALETLAEWTRDVEA